MYSLPLGLTWSMLFIFQKNFFKSEPKPLTDTDILVWCFFLKKCFFKNMQLYLPFLQSSLIIQIDLNDTKLWEHNCSSGALTAIELCPKQSVQLHFHKKNCHFTSKNKCLAQKPEHKKKIKSQYILTGAFTCAAYNWRKACEVMQQHHYYWY